MLQAQVSLGCASLCCMTMMTPTMTMTYTLKKTKIKTGYYFGIYLFFEDFFVTPVFAIEMPQRIVFGLLPNDFRHI